ncbi:pentapeptide repeat-containing protein [Robiginitomaculum antarcticum]|uniref:pentapeptide repeat-containing protein n=1 Tax=Robiginitomaculum antarcticum TaxID=437507 RepID=UPI000A0082B9|nr:pentapeptide repeat-containing protein [Robiginitomaculum antarcticum]
MNIRFVPTLTLLAALSLGSAPLSAQVPVHSRLVLSGSCSGCDLSRRDMSQLTLKGGDFTDSVFNHSDLSGGEFDGSNLSGAHFRRAYLIRASGRDVNMSRATLSGAMLNQASLVASDMSNADFRGADMSDGNFTESDFSGARFINTQASGADFSGAVFTLSELDHADFENAKFVGTRFHSAQFGHALVSGAEFSDADLSGADMSEVRGLTQDQLDRACGNHDTRLPRSAMTVRKCPKTETLAAASPPKPIPARMKMRALDYRPLPDNRSRSRNNVRGAIDAIDRALDLLPEDSQSTTRAELLQSRKHLVGVLGQL